MNSLKITFRLLILSFSLALPAGSKAQVLGNDTIIHVFNQVPQVASVQDTTAEVTFPDTMYKYEKILMHYSLAQPPGGWDPWDRIGYVRVFTQTDTFELGRIMTPYSKACGWTVDVTDFRPALAGTVNINSFILFYATGNQGYLVTIDFEFIGGNPVKEAYKIQNLWRNTVFARWEYGNDSNPIGNKIQPVGIYIDQDADSVKVNVNLTGHGQGNTDNAAEFSNKTHELRINTSGSVSHNLWRANCASNPCSPQSGTWQYNRAGWCPGADVIPWSADVTGLVTYGDTTTFEYVPQAYHNSCSPADSSCVSGVTCSDCNYNSNGHVMPWYLMQSQVVFYKNIQVSTDINGEPLANKFSVYPNPSDGIFKVKFDSRYKTERLIQVSDLQGRIISTIQTILDEVPVDISGHGKGLYFIRVKAGDNITVKKLIQL